MPASSLNSAFLATDSTFRLRVQAIMVNVAATVAGEAVGAQDNATFQQRHDLAVQVLNNGNGMLDRFVWAAACNLTVSADLGAPVAISSSTAASPVVVTTAAAHGLASGQIVEISNHLTNLSVNGTYPVTVLSTTTFSVPVVGTAAGTSGQMQLMPPDSDLLTAIQNDFSLIAGVGVLT